MSFRRLSVFALAAISSFVAASANGAIIKAANSAGTTTTATPTTTSGQRQILAKFDPFNVSSFNLDVFYEADKMEFLELHPLNGYIVDHFEFQTEGAFGMVIDIHGYFPGFNDQGIETFGESEPGEPLFPPAGNVDLFEILFADLNTHVDRTVGIQATDDDDYITGFDPATGAFTTARGPGQVDASQATIPGDPNGGGGGNAAPLPAAALVGLIGGAGVLGNAARRRRRAA